ncbi:unnamed protein product [Owenia fusiformis]|uniref:Uncharacterized protein n=1 Tax=Owenia fusiformis TaxID=6347 RepID=A0A8J1TIC8_OWEFU|nr:unnamed protein product [Owenia fusiformis]
MSLVGGYPQNFHSTGPHHEYYAAYPQTRYQESQFAHTHSEPYFQNWMVSPPGLSPDMPISENVNVYGGYTNSPSPGGDPNCQMEAMHRMGYTIGPDGQIVRVVKRKNTANKKERRRTVSINTAFANLRGCIPNVPSDTKLSKIKTLRLATSYIAYLTDVLNKEDDKNVEEFKADLSRKNESREEKKRKEMALLSSDLENSNTSSSEKKNKGRTGWPQTVWAQELK